MQYIPIAAFSHSTSPNPTPTTCQFTLHPRFFSTGLPLEGAIPSCGWSSHIIQGNRHNSSGTAPYSRDSNLLQVYIKINHKSGV